ncbi:MAG: ABC transporter permease [Chlorobi bacterium]|nr:ABC transporter permease [Chlorobiota bacterium]
MHKGAIDIPWLYLVSGYLLMIIPLAIFRAYKTGLEKSTLWALARMTVQLLLVGLYLEYIFKWDNKWINLLWVAVMTVVASYTVIKRTGLRLKLFFFPVFTATVLSIVLIDYYFLGIVIGLKNIFTARYFIPITGMLLGNSLKNVIIALDAYYTRLDEEETSYRWQLANGATRSEARLPFIRYALQRAFNPLIATTAIMGLISLPGMMTGQILGGSDPMVAVKYQIMILVVIFASTSLNVWLTLQFSNRIAFDAFGNLRKEIFARPPGRKLKRGPKGRPR